MITTFVLATFLLTTQPKQPTQVNEWHGQSTSQVIKPLSPYKPAKHVEIAEVQVVAPEPVAPSPEPVQSSGSCSDWIQAAGIDDPQSAMTLINRESSCDPWSVNPSSGSCNVAQELPCGKSGCQLGDGACSVKWMNGYVLDVYGSWAAALGHSYTYNWY